MCFTKLEFLCFRWPIKLHIAKRLQKSNFHGPIDLNDIQLAILFVLDNEEKLAKFIIQMTAEEFFRPSFRIAVSEKSICR